MRSIDCLRPFGRGFAVWCGGGFGECRAGDRLDRLDDEVGAGEVQSFLAAEMIGDRADIGLGERGDLARRRAVVALAAEQPEAGAEQRRAGLVGGRRGICRVL